MATATVKATPTANKKLIQEVAVLAVIALVIAGYFIYAGSKSASNGKEAPTATNIETGFDSAALDKVNTKPSDYPVVEPAPSELGKDDPYAPQ